MNKDIIYMLSEKLDFSSLLNFSFSCKYISEKINWKYLRQNRFQEEISQGFPLSEKSEKYKYILSYLLSKLKEDIKWEKDIISLFETEKLYLYNKIDILPKKIDLLINLKVLTLNYTQSEEIPSSLGNLTNLEQLQMCENKFKEIPDSLGNLIKLEYLNLSHGKLEKIPSSFGNLTNLKLLSICNNKLIEIPPSLGNLRNLEDLRLNFNRIKELPKELENLVQLNYLDLKGNPLNKNLLKIKGINITPDILKF